MAENRIPIPESLIRELLGAITNLLRNPTNQLLKAEIEFKSTQLRSYLPGSGVKVKFLDDYPSTAIKAGEILEVVRMVEMGSMIVRTSSGQEEWILDDAKVQIINEEE